MPESAWPQAIALADTSRNSYLLPVPPFGVGEYLVQGAQGAPLFALCPELALGGPAPLGFPDGSDSKESLCWAGDLGWIPGLGRSPGGRAWQPTPIFLPGKSPWTEEPGGLQSMGSQRVGQDWDWVTKHSTAPSRSTICTLPTYLDGVTISPHIALAFLFLCVQNIFFASDLNPCSPPINTLVGKMVRRNE